MPFVTGRAYCRKVSFLKYFAAAQKFIGVYMCLCFIFIYLHTHIHTHACRLIKVIYKLIYMFIYLSIYLVLLSPKRVRSVQSIIFFFGHDHHSKRITMIPDLHSLYSSHVGHQRQ